MSTFNERAGGTATFRRLTHERWPGTSWVGRYSSCSSRGHSSSDAK
ncbi:MAG: hypothetical protein E7L00_11915 [Propionibacteriaceae bacterium]|nr:hypothetical protein [Propionibacteriaceae bacterium]